MALSARSTILGAMVAGSLAACHGGLSGSSSGEPLLVAPRNTEQRLITELTTATQLLPNYKIIDGARRPFVTSADCVISAGERPPHGENACIGSGDRVVFSLRENVDAN
jgi:hypothetical protein